jgi:hypothetical protein
VSEVLLAVDAPGLTEGAEGFGKGTGSALHDIASEQPQSLSVFYIMKTVVYRTSVDPDVDYPADRFAAEVAIYLADPDGWAQVVDFKVGRGGKHIRLSTPSTLKTEGCEDGTLSCATLGGTEIWLNSARWTRGSAASRLPLVEYRQYMVSHEMGHSLGYDHVKCPGKGPAPVMMQQTLGIGTCTPNTKLTPIDLSSL